MNRELGAMGLSWKRFERYALHRTILECHRQELDGILHVRDDLNQAFRVYLDAGRPLFADSTSRDVTLGRVLVDLGCFTAEQYDRASINFNSERTIAKNLLSIGLVNRSELLQAAEEQIKRILRHLVSLPKGLMRFDPSALPPSMVKLEVPFSATYLEGMMAIGDREWVASKFGSEFNHVYRVKRRYVLGEPSYELILSKVDGHRTLNAIIHETGVDEFTVLKLLYTLNLLDVLELGNDPDRRWEGPLRKPGAHLKHGPPIEAKGWKWPLWLGLGLLVFLFAWWALGPNDDRVPVPAEPEVGLSEQEEEHSLDPRGMAMEMLLRRSYDDAALAYHSDLATSSGKTIALELVCQTESVDRVVSCIEPSWRNMLLVFPKSVAGNSCYWICWGEFDSELNALTAIEQLPECFQNPDSQPVVMTIAHILEVGR